VDLDQTFSSVRVALGEGLGPKKTPIRLYRAAS